MGKRSAWAGRGGEPARKKTQAMREQKAPGEKSVTESCSDRRQRFKVKEAGGRERGFTGPTAGGKVKPEGGCLGRIINTTQTSRADSRARRIKINTLPS